MDLLGRRIISVGLAQVILPVVRTPVFQVIHERQRDKD
jgi:hypothetical protein